MERAAPLQSISLFVALLAAALALGGALAHAFELANKIAMSGEHYFIMQRAYDGWNRLAYLLAVELAAILAVMILHRRQPRVFRPAAIALAGLVLAQAIFWIWTFPANQATDNWTVRPENWDALRTQWEFSHLAGAGFQLLTMTALIVAALRR